MTRAPNRPLKPVACIMCHGTDYAADCAHGQCAAEQLNLLNDPAPPTPGWFQDEEMRRYCQERDAEWREVVRRSHLPADRHDRGWAHG